MLIARMEMGTSRVSGDSDINTTEHLLDGNGRVVPILCRVVIGVRGGQAR